MGDWLSALAANGFSGFNGTHVSASLHLSEALINEILAEALNRTRSSADSADGQSSALAAPLLELVTRASVKVGEGVLVVDVELRV
jgi:hypothetical protein